VLIYWCFESSRICWCLASTNRIPYACMFTGALNSAACASCYISCTTLLSALERGGQVTPATRLFFLSTSDWAGTLLSSLHDRGPARSSSGCWWYNDTPCALIHARGACVREEHLSATLDYLPNSRKHDPTTRYSYEILILDVRLGRTQIL
jgi:hypothetical protein